MTDARFPERWLNDRRVLRLPDDAFRLFVLSLAWSVANRTDGRIYDDDLALIPASASGSARLARSGLWERVADYWQIAEFEETQTTRADMEVLTNARRRQRDKMRRRRGGTVPGHVPGYGAPDISGNGAVTAPVPRHSSGDSTRTGQARPGALRGSTEQRGSCAEPDCPRPPRSGCRTCWDHAYLETAP